MVSSVNSITLLLHYHTSLSDKQISKPVAYSEVKVRGFIKPQTSVEVIMCGSFRSSSILHLSCGLVEDSCTEFLSKSSLCKHAGAAPNVTTLCGCVTLQEIRFYTISAGLWCVYPLKKVWFQSDPSRLVVCIPVSVSFRQEVTLYVIWLEDPFWSWEGMDSSMERDHYELERLLSASAWLI